MSQSQIEEQVYPRFSSSISIFSEGEDVPHELKVKQELLRREVFEAFNGNEQILTLFEAYFHNFLKQKRGISIVQPDLNLLTLDELQEMAAAFKQRIVTQMNEMQRQQQPNRSHLLIRSIVLEQLCEQQPEKTFYQNGAWDYAMSLENIACRQEKSFFNNDHTKINLLMKSNSVKKAKAFFGIGSKQTLWVELQSKYLEKQVTVERCVEDFIFLQLVLQRIFPHSFIPPLKISEDQLKEIEIEWIKVTVLRKCENFIKHIIDHEELLENVYTFRFLVEEKYSNYEQHKKNNIDATVSNFAEYKCISGKLSSQVSQRAETSKRSIDLLSTFLQEKSIKIGNLTLEIGQKIRSIDELLFKLTEQLKLISETVTKQQLKLSFNFDPYKNFIENYRKMAHINAESLHNCETSLLQLKEQFIDKSLINWREFNAYKQRLRDLSSNYQERRRKYLQNQGVKLKRSEISLHPNEDKVDLKIGLLNLSKNERQHAWIQNQSVWYGHINSQLQTVFKSFINCDLKTLKPTLKAVLQQLSAQQLRQYNLMVNMNLSIQ